MPSPMRSSCTFDKALRIPVQLEKLGFVVLNDLFPAGEEFVKELDGLKAKRMGGKPEDRMNRSKLAGDDRPLREREPWG